MSQGTITYKGRNIYQLSQEELVAALEDIFDTLHDCSPGQHNVVDATNRLSMFFQDDVSRGCYGVWRK